MTSQHEYENDTEERETCSSGIEEIARHVKGIHQKVDDIASHLDDNCHPLREVLETASHDNSGNDDNDY